MYDFYFGTAVYLTDWPAGIRLQLICWHILPTASYRDFATSTTAFISHGSVVGQHGEDNDWLIVPAGLAAAALDINL